MNFKGEISYDSGGIIIHLLRPEETMWNFEVISPSPPFNHFLKCFLEPN